MQKKERKTENAKTLLLRRFQSLFKEFYRHAQGFSWDVSDVESCKNKLENIKDEFERLCVKEDLDYEELAIWYWSIDYISYLEERLIDNENSFWSSGTIKFDFFR